MIDTNLLWGVLNGTIYALAFFLGIAVVLGFILFLGYLGIPIIKKFNNKLINVEKEEYNHVKE